MTWLTGPTGEGHDSLGSAPLAASTGPHLRSAKPKWPHPTDLHTLVASLKQIRLILVGDFTRFRKSLLTAMEEPGCYGYEEAVVFMYIKCVRAGSNSPHCTVCHRNSRATHRRSTKRILCHAMSIYPFYCASEAAITRSCAFKHSNTGRTLCNGNASVTHGWNIS